MRVFVSTALSTGMWAPPGRFRLSELGTQSVAFSSVELAGAATTASVLRSETRGDLVPTLQSILVEAPNAPTVKVTSIETVERDIDGCTTVCEIEFDRRSATWDGIAPVADAVVRWADVIARDLQVERAATQFKRSTDLGGRGVAARAEPTPASMWTHTVVVCDEASADPSHRCTTSDAGTILPSSFEHVSVRDVHGFFALHASLVCAREADDAVRVVRLVDELHGWWSACWLLDRQLLHTAAEMAQTLSHAELPQLGPSADALADITSGVGILRARLDTFRLGLGGLDWPMWEAAARRWALEENLVSLERKRQLLVDMTSSFREALEAHQSTRLNQLAAFFAVVSSLASFVAVVIFLFPWLEEPHGFTLRVVLVALALAASLAGIVWSSRFMLRMARRSRASG